MSEAKREGNVVPLKKAQVRRGSDGPIQTLLEAMKGVSSIAVAPDGALVTDEKEAKERLLRALTAAANAIKAVSEQVDENRRSVGL